MKKAGLMSHFQNVSVRPSSRRIGNFNRRHTMGIPRIEISDQRRDRPKWGVLKLALMVLATVVISVTAIVSGLMAAESSDGAESSDSYIIGIGDTLEILTWKEEDLTRDVTVRLDGKITFPMLDEIQAAGRTPLQLKQAIQEKLKSFVDSPFVTVSLKDPGSRKFYILGEVIKTGEYPIVKNLTVLQAVALAGGFTEWASKKEILLVRKENGSEKTILIDYKALVSSKDFSKNVRIIADDTIIVP